MKTEDIDFYNKVKEKYKDDIGMLVTYANHQGDTDLLKELADNGKFNPLHLTEVEQWNYLHKANFLEGSPSETLQFYLDKGVSVNAQDAYGNMPLHYAMENNNPEAALQLLAAGANPNIPNRDNVIPLAMIGGMPERLDVLEKMLQSGGDVHFYNGDQTVLESYLPNETEPELLPIYNLMKQYA